MKEVCVEFLDADHQNIRTQETPCMNVNQDVGLDHVAVNDVILLTDLLNGNAQNIPKAFLDSLVAFQTNYTSSSNDQTSSTPVTYPHSDDLGITHDHHSSPSKQIFDILCASDLGDNTEETNLEDSGNVSDYQPESSPCSAESSEVIFSSSIQQNSFDAISPVSHTNLQPEPTINFHPQLSRQLYAYSPIQSVSPIPILPRSHHTTIEPSVQNPTEYAPSPSLTNILPMPGIVIRESSPQFTLKPDSIIQEDMRHPGFTRQPNQTRQHESIRQTESTRLTDFTGQPAPMRQPEPIRQTESTRLTYLTGQATPMRQPEFTRQTESTRLTDFTRQPAPMKQPESIGQTNAMKRPTSTSQAEPTKYYSTREMVPILPAPVTRDTLPESTGAQFVMKKKTRTSYTMKQIRSLERIFLETPYPDTEKIDSISLELEICEQKLRIWFQNKRARWRKRAKNNETTSNPIYLPPLSLAAKLRSQQPEAIPPTSYSLASQALMSLHRLSAEPNKENMAPPTMVQSSIRGGSLYQASTGPASVHQSTRGLASTTSLHTSTRGIGSTNSCQPSTDGFASRHPSIHGFTPAHNARDLASHHPSTHGFTSAHNARDLLSIVPSAPFSVTSSSESPTSPCQQQFSSGCCYGKSSTNSLQPAVNQAQPSMNMMTHDSYGCYPSNFYSSSSMPMSSAQQPELNSYLSYVHPQTSSYYYDHTQGQYNNYTPSVGFM